MAPSQEVVWRSEDPSASADSSTPFWWAEPPAEPVGSPAKKSSANFWTQGTCKETASSAVKLTYKIIV